MRSVPTSRMSRAARGALLLHALLVAGYLGPDRARGAEAHVHGEAVLEVSLSGAELSVVLRGPAQVFFGFEHPPATGDERAIVRQALASLRAPAASVMALSPPCVLETTRVRSPFPAHAAPEAEVHQRGEGSGSDHHPARGEHADLEAAYGYRCARGAPDSLTVTAFDSFPDLERIEAAWIAESGAGSATLTPRGTVLSLAAP